MASFVENRLIPFTPYVDQLPVQAMVEVGRIKQNQYEQGVQKIQSQIDNIAGMDVVRDVDKQYLQSKLNQLGGNLRMVAAGDFSNYQLVNSVGGMITKIGKDPNIQNAVSSTIKYKRGVADMETAKKEGKSSPSNEWDFMNQASAWLNSTDIRQGFSGGYSPYTNYKKNALDAIKALTKDETITDDAFTVDSRGNLVIADANVRKKFAGISPDKIQKALMATLTPGDFKQMEIDGRYNYSNVDPRRFAQSVTSSFADKVSFYNKQKRILENAKSSTTSNVEKTKLNDQIASLDKVIGTINSEYRDVSSLISSGNIEAAKAQLHTNDFIDNFSKAFSYTETSQTYESSPFAQMAMQRANKEQDWNKFLIGMKWDREKFKLSSEHDLMKFMLGYNLDKEKLSLEKEKAKKEAGVGGYEGLPQGISQEDLPRYTLGKVIADTEITTNQIDQSDETFMRTQGKDREWLEAQKEAWQRSPSGVDPKVANHFNSSEEMRRRVDANKAMIQEINQEAINRFGDIKEMIPNDPPVTYYADTGDTYVYTPEDFVRGNENVSTYIQLGAGSESAEVYDFERAQRELSPKELHLFMLQTGRAPKTPDNQILLERAKYYNKIVNVPYKKTAEDINKYTTDEVTRRVTVSQGVDYILPTGKDVERAIQSSRLAQFANLAESQKGGLPNSPDFDVEIARELVVDPKARYTLTVVEGTQYQPAMYKMTVTGDGGKTTNLRMTPEQKNSVFGSDFEPAPVVQAFRPYQEQITKMGGYTTALSPGTSNHNSAYLGKIDFPSTKLYGIKANIERTPFNKNDPSERNDNDKYSIRISAYDPITKQWYDDIPYPRTDLVREDQVIPLMIGLNDAAIFELINEKAPTAEELKQVQQASKKPF